jgi:hypothetical protein
MFFITCLFFDIKTRTIIIPEYVSHTIQTEQQTYLLNNYKHSGVPSLRNFFVKHSVFF